MDFLQFRPKTENQANLCSFFARLKLWGVIYLAMNWADDCQPPTPYCFNIFPNDYEQVQICKER